MMLSVMKLVLGLADIAVMHPDGYVEIRDRAKDIVTAERREYQFHRSKKKRFYTSERSISSCGRNARSQMGRRLPCMPLLNLWMAQALQRHVN